MKITTKIIAAFALSTGLSAPMAHIVLSEPAALAGTSYRATLRVGHGCNGATTTGIKVLIPTGFQGAKPMPKAGWTITTLLTKLDKPYNSHGKTITSDVTEISWRANTPADGLPDAWYEEFVLRGGLPTQAGPMWFKVLQTCDKGSIDWVEIPASGISTQGLKAPAALLEIIESGPAGHQH